MKWYDNSYDNIKIEKIPYRLLRVNDEIYDSIFERDGEYYLSIKCGVATYSRNHKYENFVTDGFKMIYELPREQQQEIKINLKNIKNFLQENKTVISSIPGSDISLNADIKTEYIAHRTLDKSLLIKYDNYSLKDFPMETRNYNEKIIVERLLNETEETIGYKKEDKFYIDIKENREYLEVIKNNVVNDTLQMDGGSIELPSSLGHSTSWQTEKGADIVIENTIEEESLKLIEIWGDTYQESFINLYDGQTTELGKLWHNHGTVNIVDAEDRLYQTTPPIQIEANTSYTFYIGEDSRYCLYDQQHKYVSGGISNTFSSENAKYVRICGKNPSYIQLGKPPKLSDIQHIGELYIDSRGRSILNREGNEQYKIEIESHNDNLFDGNLDSFIKIGSGKTFNITLPTYKKNEGAMYVGHQVYDRNKKPTRLEWHGDNYKRTPAYTLQENEVYIKLLNCRQNIPIEVTLTNLPPILEKNHPADLSFLSHKSNKTTILLPCQLMKVGDVTDKLYWDEKNNKYIIEKNIFKASLAQLGDPEITNYGSYKAHSWHNIDTQYNLIAKQLKPIMSFTQDKTQDIYLSYWSGSLRLLSDYKKIKNNATSISDISNEEYKTWFDNHNLDFSNIYVYLAKKKSDLIETSILEQQSLNCYDGKTYVTIDNTSLKPIVKVQVPIDINSSNQILFPRENNFDSIVNVTLNPNETTNITFFEGGLDLKLTNGIEILQDGKEYISNQDGKYASNDFIDLASYASSAFTIDVMDIPFNTENNFSIFYYNTNKEFISKSSITFNSEFYKSHIEYPGNTQYCKVAFSKPNVISDSFKIRILRDKTKKNGFQPVKRTFENTNNYTKSFSSIISIKNDIERLMFFSDNCSSITEFNIVNNFDQNQKVHSYEIPKLIESGETLSYSKSSKKQFLYKSNSTPYDAITNVSYDKPYEEYSNIANNIRFTLFRDINGNNGVFSTTNDPYCATEQYIDISEYKGKTITLSVASLMSKSYLYFYNDQQGFISRVTADNNFVSTVVPSNAHYIRCGTYLNILAAQTPETKELIQKHVMVTLTNFRCDFVPYGVKHSCTIIPETTNKNQYELILNKKDKYLFVEPYQFDYEVKDMNTFTEQDTNSSEKWSLDLFTKEGINGNYATLDNIKRIPFSSSTTANPVWNMTGVENTLLAYTKYIQTSAAFNLTVNMSIDDYGSIYLNGNLIKNCPYGSNQRVDLPLQQGMNKLIVLVINNGGQGGLVVSPDITSSLNNSIVSVGDQFNYSSTTIKDKFNTSNFFAHDIVNGKLLTPKEEDTQIRIDSTSNDKFIFAKDFVNNPDKVVDGYINANEIQNGVNSKTYINRVYGGETNLTLLTIGGNICEIYFLNDYLIEDNSHYTLYAKYTSGNQKIKISKVPDNARYIAIVTDKDNEGAKCSNIFLFPGDLTRSIDTSSSKFEMFDNFNKEIATIPYSSEIIIGKNKLPNLSKLVLDASKYTFDDINNRFIFPIKLDKDFTHYYLQYWTDMFNDSLNVFVDSTEDIASKTKQYLCQCTNRHSAFNHIIEIENNILANLTNSTLYLSVSLENESRLHIYNFLVQESYKFQLEKDTFTEVFEPYKETVEHHPMYLTANGLTIESSSSYYGIRKLEPPKNIVSKYNNGLTNITWDEVIGATSYILYLDGIALQTVYTTAYESMAEMDGMLTIKAKNSLTESKMSEAILVHSIPTNPYIIYIDNEYKNKEYRFDVHFQDNSDIETGYRVRYQIDTREEKIINLEAAPGIGSIIKTSFSAPVVQEHVIVRITAINDQGENAVASQFILKLSPEFVWTYDEDNRKITMAWDNIYSEEECPYYVIRYKKKNDEAVTMIKLPNKYENTPRIRYSIDLDPEDEMELSLSALKDDIYYIFTKPKKVSKAIDITKRPPSEFSSRKVTNDVVKFSWKDDSTMETGWELVYVLNNDAPQTIKIPTKSKETDNQIYEYEYTFPEHGFLTTKLRTVWELNTSDFTEEITDYYFPINNQAPSNLKKQYDSKTSMLITWDAQSYVESYELIITKNNVSTTVNTQDNRYIINLNDKVIEEYKVKVRTNFLGDQHSAYTNELKFKPTYNDDKLLTIMTTKCQEEYEDSIKKINKITDDFTIASKSTNKVSWNFPLMTATLSRFQLYEGLLSMETWNTGQKTEYSNVMSVKKVNVTMQEVTIHTATHQETEFKGALEAFVYTPATISGKIVMEINKTRIVCIGDSITAGHPGFWAESMTGEITHQYPYWLDRRLKFQYEVINKGYGSDRTYNVLNRFKKDVLDLSPQYCLIQIGTNDIYWGAASADGSIEAFDSSTLADMKKNVETMVELCFQHNIVPIIGMLIPRTQIVTDPIVKHGLYAFNDWIVNYANTTEGVNYVDFFNAGKDKIPPTPLEDPKSPGAMNPIYDGDNVYDEQGNLVKYGAGIHLNAAGYRIMAEAIPLNLFTAIETGVKMYMDEKCTIEATYNMEDKQNPFYEIEIEGMKLTRTKKIVRYIKNIGNTQVLFSIYPNDLYNLDYNFKFKDTDEGAKTISGILTPGNSVAIKMELTPLTEDSKSSIELSLVSREFSIETK